MGVDRKVHHFTPFGSWWCMDAADGANIGLELTQHKTGDGSVNASLQVTSSKGSHNLSISPNGVRATAHISKWRLLFVDILSSALKN
jgi:hypothetical protein